MASSSDALLLQDRCDCNLPHIAEQIRTLGDAYNSGRVLQVPPHRRTPEETYMTMMARAVKRQDDRQL